MAARAGIEPVLGFLQACVSAAASEIANSPDAHMGTQNLSELREMIETWPNVSRELRVALLAVTRAAS